MGEVERNSIGGRKGQRQRPRVAPNGSRTGKGGIEILFPSRCGDLASYGRTALSARVTVDEARTFGIGRERSVFAADGDRPEVLLRDRCVFALARRHDGSGVLLRSVNPVRKPIVGSDVIKLRRGLIVPRAPGTAAVYADDYALVAAEDHSV